MEIAEGDKLGLSADAPVLGATFYTFQHTTDSILTANVKLQ